MTPLNMAALCGNPEVLKALLGYGSKPNAVNLVGVTNFHFATTLKAAGLVHVLVDAGANVGGKNADGKTLIRTALIYSSASVITNLIQSGADKEARTNHGLAPL